MSKKNIPYIPVWFPKNMHFSCLTTREHYFPKPENKCQTVYWWLLLLFIATWLVTLRLLQCFIFDEYGWFIKQLVIEINEKIHQPTANLGSLQMSEHMQMLMAYSRLIITCSAPVELCSGQQSNCFLFWTTALTCALIDDDYINVNSFFWTAVLLHLKGMYGFA